MSFNYPSAKSFKFLVFWKTFFSSTGNIKKLASAHSCISLGQPISQRPERPDNTPYVWQHRSLLVSTNRFEGYWHGPPPQGQMHEILSTHCPPPAWMKLSHKKKLKHLFPRGLCLTLPADPYNMFRPATKSTSSPPGGNQLTALPLFSPECPRHAVASGLTQSQYC